MVILPARTSRLQDLHINDAALDADAVLAARLHHCSALLVAL